MTRLILFTLFSLFFMACNDLRSDKAVTTNQNDTNNISKHHTIDTSKTLINNYDKADSVDKANSEAIIVDEDNVQKAIVSKSDSSISLTSNIRLDHRIFGYDKPDTSSKKIILLSVFTDDVEGNPFHCTYGSFYQTSDMNDMELKYASKEGQFIKATLLKIGIPVATVYINRKWIEFE